jgi:hypothetical protein
VTATSSELWIGHRATTVPVSASSNEGAGQGGQGRRGWNKGEAHNQLCLRPFDRDRGACSTRSVVQLCCRSASEPSSAYANADCGNVASAGVVPPPPPPPPPSPPPPPLRPLLLPFATALRTDASKGALRAAACSVVGDEVAEAPVRAGTPCAETVRSIASCRMIASKRKASEGKCERLLRLSRPLTPPEDTRAQTPSIWLSVRPDAVRPDAIRAVLAVPSTLSDGAPGAVGATEGV